MNLTTTKDNELRDRGRAWLHYIQVSSTEIEDIIQGAMLSLIKDHTKRCPGIDDEEFADKNWKKMMHSSYVNWVRRTSSYSKMLDRYADSIGTYPDRVVFILEARCILNQVFPLLTESELVLISALMDNAFKPNWAAIDLGCVRQAIYQMLWRIRKRVEPLFDFSHNKNEYNGPEVEYRWKTGHLPDESWLANHPTCTEVFDTEELTQNGFTDSEEIEKVWPVTIIKGENCE